MLEIINVKKIYKTRAGSLAALDGLSVNFPDHGMVFVTGKSGSGKTTLLNIVGGLDSFDSGEIVIDGKRFSKFTLGEYSAYRNTVIGFIFQEYNLLPDYTIEKNIKIATELQGQKHDAKKLNDLLEMVDLKGLNKRKPSELSGGQKQRVAIARALIKNPKIIMADEPTGALDQATGIQVMDTLKKLSKEKLVIVVSHDMEMAEKYADRILRLVDGKLVEDVTITDDKITSSIIEENESLKIKMGATLDKNETLTLLNAIRDKKKIVAFDSEFVRNKVPTSQVACQTAEDLQSTTTEKDKKKKTFVKSKMKLSSSMFLGVRSLNVKPVRLIFTIIFSVLAFAMFGIFDSLSNFDELRAVTNILKSGDYPTITASAQYNNNGLSSHIRVNQGVIDNLNNNTGYDFRGLYEIDDLNEYGTGRALYIKEPDIINTVPQGKSYYFKVLNDIVEFSDDEITGEGKQGDVVDPDGFNMKIVCGEWPSAPIKYEKVVGLPETERYMEKSFYDVAISKYTAESIVYWLNTTPGKNLYKFNDENGEPNIGGRKIDSIEKLIGVPIRLQNERRFFIRAIVDTGEIPARFDSLKELAPSTATNLLADDLRTYLDAGLFFKVFVPEGYVDAWREYNNSAARYFTNTSSFTINGKGLTGTQHTHTSFYKPDDYVNEDKTSDNIIMFEDERNSNISLAKNEIIINVRDFQNLYGAEINDVGQALLADALKVFNEVHYHPYDIIQSYLKRVKNEFTKYNNRHDNQLSLVKDVLVTQQQQGSGNVKKITCKIVGVYFGIDAGAEDNTNSGIYMPPYGVDYGEHDLYSLMIPTSLMQSLNVYHKQDKFIRMTSPASTNVENMQALATIFSEGTGVKVAWYGNTVLVSLQKNRAMLNQVTEIMLYISIALASFSIFMLFNYIAVSISSKKRSVGILRALGSKSRDIASIFFTESMIISIINGILACFAAALGCVLVNTYIQSVMGLSISFAIYGFRQILIIMGISLVTGIIASLTPIIRIVRKKPVNLIRKP